MRPYRICVKKIIAQFETAAILSLLCLETKKQSSRLYFLFCSYRRNFSFQINSYHKGDFLAHSELPLRLNAILLTEKPQEIMPVMLALKLR